MYKLFYGLAEAPFNLTPDSKFLYMSRRHNEALTALAYGVSERKGFICLTGEIGSGKTTTLRALISRLDETQYSIATILNSYLTDLELLKTINEEFGLSGESNSKKALLDELNAFLVEEYRHGRNCVLILDESQNLRPDTLEQIRMISNLETETDKLIQIVMVGQPELRRTLELPELEQLNQRITVRYHVGPLDEDEVPAYIHHRLHVARAQEKIELTPQALRLIYHYSKGIPRRINVICDRCLLVGYVLARFDIDGEMVQQAVDEIRGVSQPKRPEVAAIQETEHPRRGWRPSRQTLMMLTAAVAIVGIGFLAGASFRSLTRPDTRTAVAAAGPEAAGGAYAPSAEAPDGPGERGMASSPGADQTAGDGPGPDPGFPMPTAERTPRPKRTAKATPEANSTGLTTPKATSEAIPGESPGAASLSAGRPTAGDEAIAIPLDEGAGEAPVEVARGPEFKAWSADPQGVIRVDRPDLAAPAAYLQMLAAWGIEVDLEPFTGAPPQEVALYDMKAMVGQLDFRTYTTPELNSALKPNLPILLKHGPGVLGSAPTAAVVGRTGDRFQVADPQNGLKDVTLEELTGKVVEATVLYYDPHGLTGLKVGDRGGSVETLQRSLSSAGTLEGKIDGIFGPQVREAVRKFQKNEGLPVNGRMDAATSAVLCAQIDPNRPRLKS